MSPVTCSTLYLCHNPFLNPYISVTLDITPNISPKPTFHSLSPSFISYSLLIRLLQFNIATQLVLSLFWASQYTYLSSSISSPYLLPTCPTSAPGSHQRQVWWPRHRRQWAAESEAVGILGCFPLVWLRSIEYHGRPSLPPLQCIPLLPPLLDLFFLSASSILHFFLDEGNEIRSLINNCMNLGLITLSICRNS